MNTLVKFDSYWGIDVSKEWIDISCEGNIYRVVQKKENIEQFIQSNKKSNENILVVLESTGGYEKLTARCCEKAGATVHIAHPNKVVAFARAKGRLAKTVSVGCACAPYLLACWYHVGYD